MQCFLPYYKERRAGSVVTNWHSKSSKIGVRYFPMRTILLLVRKPKLLDWDYEHCLIYFCFPPKSLVNLSMMFVASSCQVLLIGIIWVVCNTCKFVSSVLSRFDEEDAKTSGKRLGHSIWAHFSLSFSQPSEYPKLIQRGVFLLFSSYLILVLQWFLAAVTSPQPLAIEWLNLNYYPFYLRPFPTCCRHHSCSWVSLTCLVPSATMSSCSWHAYWGPWTTVRLCQWWSHLICRIP